MRWVNQLLIIGLMWLGSYAVGFATVAHEVTPVADETVINPHNSVTANKAADSTSIDDFSAQLIEQLLVQWPVDALNLQLTHVQQELMQLHQQVVTLSLQTKVQPSAATATVSRGIVGGWMFAHPLVTSVWLFVMAIGMSSWLLMRRWHMIQAAELTLTDDTLQMGSHDKIASQLDMAMSYFSLEQYSQAMALIHQVLVHGDEQQRAEAHMLQQQIQQAVG